jgi:hypothetical protein
VRFLGDLVVEFHGLNHQDTKTPRNMQLPVVAQLLPVSYMEQVWST